jgi:predicted transcriptional regulator
MTDHEDAAVAALAALGFGEYEARVYVALLAHGPLSGYEVSKRSGVPRPNVYPALRRLTDRGAVVALAARRGALYQARPAAEVLERLAREQRERLEAAAAALARLAQPADEPLATALAGEEELVGRARRLVAAAEARLFLAVVPATAGLLVTEVERAMARGVQVTTQCVQACPAPCGGCRGDVFRHATELPPARWLLVVADERELLAADLTRPGKAATGLATRHPALVRLAVSALQDGIAAAEIVRSLGGAIVPALDPTARAVLEGPALADRGRRSWLERLRHRLRGATP